MRRGEIENCAKLIVFTENTRKKNKETSVKEAEKHARLTNWQGKSKVREESEKATADVQV